MPEIESKTDLARPTADATENTRTDRPWELELYVNNHPGVMSHICGLFARRAFNVEKIFCLPIAPGKQSRICLAVDANGRVDQIINQLKRLEDVLEVHSLGPGGGLFAPLEGLGQP